MGTFLSRRRFELVALAIAGTLGAFHLWSELQSPVEQTAHSRGPLLDLFARGVQVFEGRATDLKFRLRGPQVPHPDVVVVAIDEKSVQRFGLFPWSRSVTARAIVNLHRAGARAIGLDMAFPDQGTDHSEQTYREVLQKFDEIGRARPKDTAGLSDFRSALAERASHSPDRALAEAFQQAPEVIQSVIGYQAEHLNDFLPAKVEEHVALLSSRVIPRLAGPSPGSSFELPAGSPLLHPAYSGQTPLPLFAPPGSRFGLMDAVTDLDGALRRTPLMFQLSSPRGLLPGLALASAAAYFDSLPEAVFESSSRRVIGVRLRAAGGRVIQIPYQGDFPYTLINYVGSKGAFPTLSIGDVIEGSFDPAAVRGKVVLVGNTLVGSAGDQRVTPFEKFEPGIYTHASIVSNILAESFLVRPSQTVALEFLGLMAIAFLLAAALPRLRQFRLKGLLIFGLLGCWLTIDQMMFARGIQVATVIPMLTILSSAFGLVFLGYLSVDREKLQLRSTFSRYLGEDVIEEALKHPEKLNQGEKREMTVLFSDIRGFTTLSERMVPEKLAQFIKDYLTPMTQIVFDEKGTLDKYIGDALMAFWNAPLDQADHALRACRAAVAFFVKLEELKLRWRAEGFPEFDIGVGINSGPMIVGNMGSDVRVDYTVMGDSVNLASRLEGTNKEYDTRILISENTFDRVKGQVVARRLGAVRVKGKRKPVWIYELRGIGVASGDEARAIALFEEGLLMYTERRFEDAATRFNETLAIWPKDGPTTRYIDEIARLRLAPPPPSWDGVYTATTK